MASALPAPAVKGVLPLDSLYDTKTLVSGFAVHPQTLLPARAGVWGQSPQGLIML